MKKPINESSSAAVIIVFGRTGESKVARGAKFPVEDREKALAAALDRKFELIVAFDEETRRLAEELPEGRFAVNGRAQLPTITSDLYDRLRALAQKSDQNGAQGEPAPPFTQDESDAASEQATDRPPTRAESSLSDAHRQASQLSDPMPVASHRLRGDSQSATSGAAATKIAGIDKQSSDATEAAEPTEIATEKVTAEAVAEAKPAGATEMDFAPERSGPPANQEKAPENSGFVERQGEASEVAAAPAPEEKATGSALTGEAIAPALIVFGRTGIARPRAGWHPLIEAGLARKAAERQGLLSLPILTPEEFQIASQIGRGRLFGHGTLFVPTVPLALFDKLVQLYQKGRGEGRKDVEQGRESAGPRFPKSWAEIGVGSLVLAPEENDEGWWEAEALAVAGDELALRWRLDPNEPVFVRKLTQVALLNPNGSA
ncbi:MAG TPA: hypothetical protein VND97_02785 [Beijerinckiaceae bacterium]|nr:hypothetical protein [Beijerinckiaceae bacterium]